MLIDVYWQKLVALLVQDVFESTFTDELYQKWNPDL